MTKSGPQAWIARNQPFPLHGMSEYQIQIAGAWYRWPDGLRHYFDTNNVIPSKQFYDLINTLSGNLNW